MIRSSKSPTGSRAAPHSRSPLSLEPIWEQDLRVRTARKLSTCYSFDYVEIFTCFCHIWFDIPKHIIMFPSNSEACPPFPHLCRHEKICECSDASSGQYPGLYSAATIPVPRESNADGQMAPAPLRKGDYSDMFFSTSLYLVKSKLTCDIFLGYEGSRQCKKLTLTTWRKWRSPV